MALISRRRFAGIGPVPELVRAGIGEDPYTLEYMNISEVMDPMGYLRETTTGRERWFGVMEMNRGMLVILVSFIQWAPNMRAVSRNEAPIPANENI
jgi:hypothetical protein